MKYAAGQYCLSCQTHSDRVVVVHHYRIGDAEIAHRTGHVAFALLTRNLGRVNADHDEALVVVLGLEGVDVWGER